MKLRYKTLPKIVYFVTQLGFTIPLLVYNWTYLKDEGLKILVPFLVVTVLTYAAYLRAALSDPGYINSMMFNKAYANNETEISQNITQQGETPLYSQISQIPSQPNLRQVNDGILVNEYVLPQGSHYFQKFENPVQ